MDLKNELNPRAGKLVIEQIKSTADGEESIEKLKLVDCKNLFGAPQDHINSY